MKSLIFVLVLSIGFVYAAPSQQVSYVDSATVQVELDLGALAQVKGGRMGITCESCDCELVANTCHCTGCTITF